MLWQIRVKAHLSDEWIDWFGGLKIENQSGGEAVLFGTLPDQAALYGVLDRIKELGVALVSVNCVEPSSEHRSLPSHTGEENERLARDDDVRDQSQA